MSPQDRASLAAILTVGSLLLLGILGIAVVAAVHGDFTGVIVLGSFAAVIGTGWTVYRYTLRRYQ